MFSITVWHEIFAGSKFLRLFTNRKNRVTKKKNISANFVEQKCSPPPTIKKG